MSAPDDRGRIRTPDQRLRVFVSSTLRELEAERRAARGAIERLHLAPVMFELGARPHPPRDLYRAYLEQSDVFVGIYGERYGWVAPGEDVSGLEDEYRLAPPRMPRLIYVREGAAREPRLEALIDRIRADDTASYTPYRSPEELSELVEADLATLLAERFDAASGPPTGAASAAPLDPLAARIPSPYTRIIGRDREVEAVLGLLADRDLRLVTLLGPGGIGKSRLAIAVAEAAGPHFPDGVAFVTLENVLEPALLLPTIGAAVGLRDTGELPLEERLAIALEGRRMLFVLDNFEQLVVAAPILVRLFTLAPDASFLVTSRSVLRVRGERVVEVPPLQTHDGAATDSARARSSPAVELFVERAHAVKPDFEVTEAGLDAIVGICRMLEGIPLAIELAAARMRVLTPAAILQRLDRQLPMLVDASRDLPPRQRTLRSTIEWSTGLLTEHERAVLRDLSVCSPGFTVETVEALAEARGWPVDVFAVLETLVDSSLLHQQDVDGVAVFSMLATVREHGVEQLREAGEEGAARDAHAAVYAELARREGRGLGFSEQMGAVARLNLERGNLRTAVRHLTSVGDAETAADMAWRLFLYWWAGAYLTEVAHWMEEAVSAAASGALPARTRAIAAFFVGWRDMWVAPSHDIAAALLAAAAEFERDGDELGGAMCTATAGFAEILTSDPDLEQASAWLSEGARRFRALGAGWGESLALVALARISALGGDVDAAAEQSRRSMEAAVASGDRFSATVAMHHLARMQLFRGRTEEAERLLLDATADSVRLRHEEGIAYGLEGLAAIAADRDDIERAGVLAGAAAAIRRRTAVFDAPAFVYHTRHLDALAARGHAERLRAAEARGREYGSYEAAEYALTGRVGGSASVAGSSEGAP